MGIREWLSGEGRSYEVSVVCTNCGHTVIVRIGHGKTIEGWGRNAKCRVCKNTGHWEREVN